MSGPIPDQELIAIPLKLLKQLQQQATDGGANSGVPTSSGVGGCCCKQFVEIGQPIQGESFRFVGSVTQFSTQFSVAYVFSVPAGMEGVINRIGIYEIMPGIQSANRVSLLVNGEFNSQFPRMAGNVGAGAEVPLNVNIYLKQNDVVSVLMDCPYIIWDFGGQDPFLEYSLVFSISGYYINDGYFAPLGGVQPGGVC